MDAGYLRALVWVLLVTTLGSCAHQTVTYRDISPVELTSDSLPPGQLISLNYHDGSSSGFFRVAEVTEDQIVSTAGDRWSKRGIRTLKARFERLSRARCDDILFAVTHWECAGLM